MIMDSSMRFGLMAVFAVSGSMVFLVHQVHKRLLSNFMKNFEFEMGHILYGSQHHGQKKKGCVKNHQGKKKVRFAKQVLELPMENNKSCSEKLVRKAERIKAEEVMENIQKSKCGPKLEDVMPPNRAVLYRGIMNNKRGRFRF